MFGKNKIEVFVRSNHDVWDNTYNVHSIFKTVQGEGPFTGQAAIFVRFAGCNLKCSFCDTDFEEGKKLTAAEIFKVIVRLVDKLLDLDDMLLVITGGEPLLQYGLGDFLRLAKKFGMRCQIETAGTIIQQDLLDYLKDHPDSVHIVCSPKTRNISKSLIPYIKTWKYVLRKDHISEEDGLPVISPQTDKFAVLARPPRTVRRKDIVVVPCDEQSLLVTAANTSAALSVALKYGYTINLQLHKILNVE